MPQQPWRNQQGLIISTRHLRYYYRRPVRSSKPVICGRRGHATQNTLPPDIPDVAVLGGGITGLSTAFYLSKSLPTSSRIVLFEASSRLGGWLNSTSVDVGSGNVVFEGGPRTLRPSVPNGLVTLELVRDLGMEDRIISTSKNSVAAQNRFIYYPDHLVRMPGPGSNIFKNLSTVWREPLFSGLIRGLLSEINKPRRPDSVTDESIGSFISRRFGSAVSDNIVSALFHGIYAGDIYNLSARTILPSVWHMEGRHTSIVKGTVDQLFGGLRPQSDDDFDLTIDSSNPLPTAKDLLGEVKESSVFTFKRGLGELSDRLEQRLEECPNVFIHKDTSVDHVRLDFRTEGSKIELMTNNTITKDNPALWDFSHAISTIPGSVLADRLEESSCSSILRETKSVTVMVVNLFFSNPSILPAHGFGYLLPKSLPFEQNPELALGVIFDTDATIGQDAVPGTKMTVMLGGHWWNDWDEYPDEAQGTHLAKAILSRHLNINEEPRAVRVSLQRNCIPQYSVGHDDRMQSLSKDLEKVFSGRLRVAGNSYTGVGLNDCVRAARDAVKGLVTGQAKTGLESFVDGRKWSWWPPNSLKKSSG